MRAPGTTDRPTDDGSRTNHSGSGGGHGARGDRGDRNDRGDRGNRGDSGGSGGSRSGIHEHSGGARASQMPDARRPPPQAVAGHAGPAQSAAAAAGIQAAWHSPHLVGDGRLPPSWKSRGEGKDRGAARPRDDRRPRSGRDAPAEGWRRGASAVTAAAAPHPTNPLRVPGAPPRGTGKEGGNEPSRARG